MRIFVIAAFSLIIFSLYLLLLKPEFNSAFEADQQCHFEMEMSVGVRPDLGCDHDLETRQWILFSKGKDSLPAEVVKRFRY